MDVKVLGTGCAKCNKPHEQAKQGIAESGIAANLLKVEKMADIMAYAVMLTPALVINDEVKSSGRIPSPSEIAAWLRAAAE